MERTNYNSGGYDGGNRGGRNNGGRSSDGGGRGGRGNWNYHQQYNNNQHQEQYGGGRGGGSGRESGGIGNARGRGQQTHWTPANPWPKADRVPDRFDGGREGNTRGRGASEQAVGPQTLIQNRTVINLIMLYGGNRGDRNNGGRGSDGGGRGGNGRGNGGGYSHGGRGNWNYQQQYNIQHQEQYGGGRGGGRGRESGGIGNARGRGQQTHRTPANPWPNADRVPDRFDGGREGNTRGRGVSEQAVGPQTLIQNRTDHQVQDDVANGYVPALALALGLALARYVLHLISVVLDQHLKDSMFFI